VKNNQAYRLGMAYGIFTSQDPYLLHFIFFETDERAQKANALHYTHLQMFARDKYSSLLGPWESYKENEML
jgi:hypothetical protein